MTSAQKRSESSTAKAPLTETARARLTEIVAELKRREAKRSESLADFVPRVSPQFVAPLHLAPALDVFERIARGERVRACISIPPQHGKPLHEDTPVTMADGTRRAIRDIVVGDRVVSGRGRITTVAAVYDQGELDTLRIVTRGGREIVAEGSHRFLTASGWKRADALRSLDTNGRERDELIVPSHHSRETASVGGVHAARMLGYIIGDGGVTTRSTCWTNADPEVVESFRRATESFGCELTAPTKYTYRVVKHLPRYTTEDKRRYFREYERSRRAGTPPSDRPHRDRLRNPVREFLDVHGVSGCGAYEKRVPVGIFSAPDDEVAAFVAAYFECDGTRASRANCGRAAAGSSFSSVSKPLLEGVRTLLSRLGIRSNLYAKNGRYNGKHHLSWTLAILDDARFFDVVPVVGAKAGSSDRSRRYEPTSRDVHDAIVRVEPAGRARCLCITVADDESFLANDCVTHNTEAVLHALAWLLRRRPDWTLAFATYQQEQSDDKSHAARDIARRAGVALSADRANLRFWRTGERGGCLFTAVGGPFTGQGVRAAIVDDPYKGRSEALSDATRKHVERWFSSVVLQRGQEDLSVIVIHTRWCEDDLIGRIAAGAFGDGWQIVNLPLLALDDGTPAPRPYDRATRVLNPRRTMPNGDIFGWSLEGAIKHLLALPEADAESLAQGKPRKRVDGALWSWECITPWRLIAEPPRSRCEVFVDPNASDEAHAAKADDAGVVTISRGIDGRAYVLDDASGHMGVDGWPARAVAAYRKHRAHAIVAESDGGGAMVEKTIRAWLLAEAQERSRMSGRHVEAERIPVRLVRVGARGDKRGRAETARHLYGDPTTARPSAVSHVGHHERLETSMTSHDFATTRRSPGDLDALSLGLAELMLTHPNTTKNTTAPAAIPVRINEAF